MLEATKTALFLAILATLAVIPGRALAQGEKYNYLDDEGPGFNSGNKILLGYSANVPNQYLGFNLGFSRPRTWGIFLEYKMNTTSLEIAPYLYDDLTVEEVENYKLVESPDIIIHTFKQSRGSWICVNTGITRPLSENLCSYLGLGISFYRVYRQYYEIYGSWGDQGYFWINDPTNSTVNLNVTGGIYFKLGRYLYLQLGGNIRPLGLGAGLGLAP